MEKTRKVQQILYGLKIRAHALMIKIPQSGLTRIILSSVWHIYLTSMSIQVQAIKIIDKNNFSIQISRIFYYPRKAVTCISFAHRSRSTLALGSADGSVSICSCLSEPPQVDRVLDGRSGPVAKLEWSTNNELILTASQTGVHKNLDMFFIFVYKVLTDFWKKSDQGIF